MRQRIVIKVAMEGQKSRSKIMKIVGGSVPGLQLLAFPAQDHNHIVVIGDGIDSVALTVLLRKKVGPSEIVSVGPVEYGGDGNNTVPMPLWGYSSYGNPEAYGSGHGYEVRYQHPYPYGAVGHGFETKNQKYDYGSGYAYETRNPYGGGPGHGYETMNQNHNPDGCCSIM